MELEKGYERKKLIEENKITRRYTSLRFESRPSSLMLIGHL
jgi:hypothetical protein